MYESQSLGDFSRWLAAVFLGEQNGRSVSKIIADLIADFLQFWVHAGMVSGTVYALGRS